MAGRSVAYHRAGAGPPLLLLHGGWSDGRSWRPQLAGLSDAFDVIAWDTPGCGGSDELSGRPTMADYADAVADLVAALDVDRPHVCGLSFGGGLAMTVFQRHPELVRSLILAGAYAGWKGSLAPEEIEARLRQVRAECERPPVEWVDGYLSEFFTRTVSAEVIDDVRMMVSDVRPAGLLAMSTAFAEADLTAVLPTIGVPTLLLHGEFDARAPRRVANALHAGIPGSELVVLPGVGHDLNLEAPEAFNAEVRRFLGSRR